MKNENLKKIKILAKIGRKDDTDQFANEFGSISEGDLVKWFVVDKKWVFGDFLRYFSRFLCKLSGQCEIDVDSFYSALTTFSTEQIDMGLVFATTYASVVPYSRKTSKQKQPPQFTFTKSLNSKLVQEMENLTFYVNQARRLQDIPSNLLFPEAFVNEIKQLVHDLPKLKIKVLDRQQLAEKGLNLFLGVNKGSSKEPRLLIVEYLANPESKEVYGLVGKGITFDSGGMNIKVQSYMSTMKFDMSGAAIACATVLALAKNAVKTNVIAVAALTENSIGSNAQKPDDIVVSYDGKTVQIDNTDAEGRLVLADAIAYARKDLKVTRIYTIATLTGAIGVTFGDVYTGVWSTDHAIWKELKKSADFVGELVWRMPFHSEYRHVLNTAIADLSNISNRNFYAGSSVAATFLLEFSGDVPLVHLDVASTAVSQEKTGTGIMIRTLYQICKLQK